MAKRVVPQYQLRRRPLVNYVLQNTIKYPPPFFVFSIRKSRKSQN
jgi:hypothetical protein